MTTTSDQLNRAAELMMERGHAKGRYTDKAGRVCLMGSLYEVAEDAHNAALALRAVIGPCVMTWNDRPETTEAMAIGVLHEAAIYAKEHGL